MAVRVLLTGLATCATCGGGMTLRAGTHAGDVYRYYSCNNAMKKGNRVQGTLDPWTARYSGDRASG